jgi:hypothetical protein
LNFVQNKYSQSIKELKEKDAKVAELEKIVEFFEELYENSSENVNHLNAETFNDQLNSDIVIKEEEVSEPNL